MLAAFGAGAIGVSLTALLVATHFRYRFVRLVKAAERIAAGDYTIQVDQQRRRPRGAPGHRRQRHLGRPRGHPRPRDRRPADRRRRTARRCSPELFSEVVRATRYERPLSVAFVDIDHFKAVNDTYGHAIGDVVLRGVAQTLAANLRATDTIGRYGGEEFMMILTETDIEEGAVLSEKLRTLVQRQRFAVEGGSNISVTISIGIAGGIGNKLRMETLIRDADAAMYSAKSLGRNQTYIFAEPDDDNRVPRAPISAAGRARAMQVGQQARDAATAALTSVLAAAPPLPRPAVADDRDDRRGDGQAAPAAGRRHRQAAHRGAAPRRRQGRRAAGDPRQAVGADVGRVADGRPAPAHRPGHPRAGRGAQGRRCRSSCTTTSATPGTAIRSACAPSEIPLGARIVAVADAYDAMVHDRPYKRAMTHEAAIAELRRHAGTQFDPELVESFCDLYANEAPAPDPAVLAMIAGNTAHAAQGAHDGPTIMVPDAVPGPASRAVRRRRRTDDVAADSRTMGPDGALDVASSTVKPRSTRRHEDSPTGTNPVTSLPAPGSTRSGRSESAS